jgi:hypothetical protein
LDISVVKNYSSALLPKKSFDICIDLHYDGKCTYCGVKGLIMPFCKNGIDAGRKLFSLNPKNGVNVNGKVQNTSYWFRQKCSHEFSAPEGHPRDAQPH